MMMTRTSFSRRKLLRKMGLGVAAPLVSGMANGILAKAFGADRRVGIFVVHGETFPMRGANSLTPEDVVFETNPGARYPSAWNPYDARIQTWPAMLQPFEPIAEQMVFVDGMALGLQKTHTCHGLGYMALSGIEPPDNPSSNTPVEGLVPGGISIDQHAANAFGRDTPISSLLIGLQRQASGDVGTTFAKGPNQPLTHTDDPAKLRSLLIGNPTDARSPDDLRKATAYRDGVLDMVRQDLKRLEVNVAAEERTQLEAYIEALDSYDRRQRALGEPFDPQRCGEWPQPRRESAQSFERYEDLMALASLALQCGVTNVLGVSIGNGRAHDDIAGFGVDGHADRSVYFANMAAMYARTLPPIAKLIQSFGLGKNNVVMVMVPSNGFGPQNHHGLTDRFPGLVYDGTGTLRTGRRYLLVDMEKRHPLTDLYTGVTHALGSPVAKFNGNGTGALPGLLA